MTLSLENLDIDPDAARQYIDARAAFSEFEPTRKSALQMRGGMVWKGNVEHALAHQLKDKAEAAYARGTLFDKRRSLMADWAQFCDTEITSIPPRP